MSVSFIPIDYQYLTTQVQIWMSGRRVFKLSSRCTRKSFLWNLLFLLLFLEFCYFYFFPSNAKGGYFWDVGIFFINFKTHVSDSYSLMTCRLDPFYRVYSGSELWGLDVPSLVTLTYLFGTSMVFSNVKFWIDIFCFYVLEPFWVSLLPLHSCNISWLYDYCIQLWTSPIYYYASVGSKFL